MKVTLSENQAKHATMIEQDMLERGLELPGNKAVTNGNVIGAQFAVAKALNLFPHFGDGFPSPHLVGRTHAPILALWFREAALSYSIHQVSQVYVIVTGVMPDFELQGFAYFKALQPQDHGYTLFTTAINPIQSSQVFWELINDSRNYQISYKKDEDGTWIPAIQEK